MEPKQSGIGCATSSWQAYHILHRLLASDGIIFKKNSHLQGKAHTFTIESHNNRSRYYLARRRRKAHSYTRKLQNIAASILLYLLKNNINIY